MAPSIQHRILFRRDQKRYLVNLGNTLTIAGMTALALAIVLSLVLVAHFLFGPGAAWTAGGLAFVAFALLWYALPDRAPHDQSQSRSRVPGREAADRG